jgi:hypothetical protein
MIESGSPDQMHGLLGTLSFKLLAGFHKTGRQQSGASGVADFLSRIFGIQTGLSESSHQQPVV